MANKNQELEYPTNILGILAGTSWSVHWLEAVDDALTGARNLEKRTRIHQHKAVANCDQATGMVEDVVAQVRLY